MPKELQSLEPCLDPAGKLIVKEGKSSRVYQMRDKETNKKFAVKCYHWSDNSLESRYAYLKEIKEKNDISFLIPCTFHLEGTLIQGEKYPVLVMDWIEGVPFREFLSRAAGVPRIVDKLGRLLARIERKMYRAGIAHCCLEAEHLMLGSNSSEERGVLVLLDYDNIWTPQLAHQNILESSDPLYHHSQRVREGIFGPLADRFAFLLLYTTLTAIKVLGPKFYKEKSNDQGIIFSQQDLSMPDEARIFKELLGQKDKFLRGITLELQNALAKPMGWISSLESIINRVKDKVEQGEFSWAEIRFDEEEKPSSTESDFEEEGGLKKVVEEMAASGAMYAAHGNFEEAIKLYTECCNRDPGNLACRKKLRECQMKNLDNKPPTGLSALSGGSYRSKVNSYFKSGQHVEVLEVGESALAANPWDSPTQRTMGKSADELGFHDVAAWLFQSAYKISPNEPDVLQDLAEFLERQSDFKSARVIWERIAKLKPGDIDAVRKAKELGASETMKRMSDNKDVVVTTQKENPAIAEEQRMRGMLQDQPHWAPFYIDLATILKKGNRFEEAEATLKRGIVQCSADKRLLLELAHLEKVILTKRLEEIKEVVREDSQWPYAKVASDSIEIEQRRRDSEVLRLRTEADPGNTEARLKLGLMLLDLGDIDNAISELQLSRKDPRLAWKALAALGKCFSAKNNIALARRNLEDALKALPKEEDEPRKEILFTLAQSHATTGDFDKAVEIANEIANIDFSYQGIGKLLDEWMAKARQA